MKCGSSSGTITGCTTPKKIKICPWERDRNMTRVSVPWSKALKFKLDKTAEDTPHLNGLALASTMQRTKEDNVYCQGLKG